MTGTASRSEHGRRPLARFACALAAALWTSVALAQAADDGMIVIPGRGETAEAALAHANAANGGRTAPPAAPARATGPVHAAPMASAQPADGTAAAFGAPHAAADADPSRILTIVAGTPAAAPMDAPRGAIRPTRTPVARDTLPAGTSAMRMPATAAAPAMPAARQPGAPLPGQQDSESIRRTALAFLQQQIAGLPGKTTVTVSPTLPRGLAACTTLTPFLPAGARLWGRTTIGVRCAGERPWTVYLQAKITVQATYYVAARQIAPGEALTAADLVAREGDLTVLPLAIITDPSQAIGATALSRVGAGLPLRQDMLKSAASVSAGQTVRVVAAGPGFTISAEGSVLANAAPGQQVRVRMAAGQIVTATVKDAGTVEIPL